MINSRTLSLGVVLALLVGGAAFGQPTGNVHGTILDNDGAALPGVTVTLSGLGADRILMTDDQGAFRFLSLDPGRYALEAVLDGFSTIEYPGVEVRTGRNTTFELTLSQAVEETITVTSESPLLDERRLTAGTQITQIELEKIPTARDPWALLSQTPGVSVDRINVGGSESGQQSIFRAQGVSSTENDFLVDGVQITDMGATGASPTYYDFDQFAEISLSTGSSDVSKNTAGVELNMVTKRGTNEFRGSAYFYNTKADGYFNDRLSQATPDLASELFTAEGQTELVGAQIDGIEDIGFEMGGAAVQDRLWMWGSWSQNDIKTFASSGDSDDTILENTAIKFNIQFNDSNSGIASMNNGDKLKAGRGAGPTRSPESLWDQRGPSAIYRFEDTHIVSSNSFITGSFSKVDLGFALLARGPSGVPNGLDPAAPDPVFDGSGVWQDNFLSGSASRPGDEFRVESSYFFSSGNVDHELKGGARLRTVEGTDVFSWGPRNVFHTFWGATVARHSQAGPSTNEYASLWAQDTISFGKATFNFGLRFDDQSASTDAVSLAAHQVFPEILPALNVPAGASDLSLTSVKPRLGFTYALGQERDTLLRASFSQFASALGSGLGNWASPTYYGWYAYFYEDAAGDLYLYTALYFDPLNPSQSPNRHESGLDAETTSELVLSIEHAITPGFVVGFNVTMRNTTDIIDAVHMVRDGSGGLRLATLADYELQGSLAGTIPRSTETYDIPYYDLINTDPFSTLDGAPSGGFMLLNGDRERDYLGYSVTFTKRLANRWMARGYFNYGDADWSVPNNYLPCRNAVTNVRGGGCTDGDLYVNRSSGSGKGERFLQSTWSYNLNGMYQVAPDRPWGFNLAGNISGRQGHPTAYYQQTGTTGGLLRQNVAADLDDHRLDDPVTVDLRLEKEFNTGGPVTLTLGLDAFNVTNDNTGLSYQANVGTTAAGYILDNVSPRIYRLGVRIGWK